MPTSVLDNKQLVEEGDAIEGVAKKVDDMIVGEDKSNSNTVGFQPTYKKWTNEAGETLTFLRSQNPGELNA